MHGFGVKCAGRRHGHDGMELAFEEGDAGFVL